jgi:predicted MPP superfamily phosphohydrolase
LIKIFKISGIFPVQIMNPVIMFLPIITLAYILPNIYIFFRLGNLFVNREYKFYYVLVYLFLAVFFPLVNIFANGDSGILGVIANYLLPYYLYLTLSLLAFDLFLLVNRLLKIVPAEKIKSTGFKMTGLCAVLLLPCAIVIAGAINFNTIRLSEYQIDVPCKSAKISHLKIAFVADFHLKRGVDLHYVERFARQIEVIQPDLMIYGGDIVEGNREDESMRSFEKVFRTIHPKYGVFAVFGNHEFYGRQDKGQFFDRAGMKLLCDSNVVIDGSFNLLGRYDSHFGKRKSIGELLKSVNDSLPIILIDHRPTEIEEVSKTAVDVQLSGHTHDGQLFPINLILKTMYRLTWGYEKIGNTNFFVTSGIRLWGPPVRTTGKSEIMVIDVNFK